MTYPVEKPEEEWLKILGREKYRVLREKGTDMPHTGKYNLHFEDGTYNCGACGTPLFESEAKFNSSCGWPSFDQSIPGKLEYIKDSTHGMVRTEIVCANCGSHVGHVFDDGPTVSGQRYCVNSSSIEFDQ